MNIIRSNPRKLFQQNKIISGAGVNKDIIIKRNAQQSENFSEYVNPIPSRVGLHNIDKKQMAPNPANQFKPPSALDINTDLLNGISFKQTSKAKPKKVKLSIK
jgi:hypothetical protein